MIHKIAILAFVIMIGAFGIANKAHAADPVYTSTFSNKAIGGYDTVSYFKGSGKPVKGSADFQTKWRGANWLFSSQENLEAFKADPEKYAPQYGGYCAWAASQGSLAKGNPNVYTLYNDKLYLNINKKTSEKWSPRKAELIPMADEKYPDLVDLK